MSKYRSLDVVEAVKCEGSKMYLLKCEDRFPNWFKELLSDSNPKAKVWFVNGNEDKLVLTTWGKNYYTQVGDYIIKSGNEYFATEGKVFESKYGKVDE